MRQTSLDSLRRLCSMGQLSQEALAEIAGLEQQIDDMTAAYRQNQMMRLRQGSCSDEACTLYSEMLTDFERIGDHATNIAEWVEFSILGRHPEQDEIEGIEDRQGPSER